MVMQPDPFRDFMQMEHTAPAQSWTYDPINLFMTNELPARTFFDTLVQQYIRQGKDLQKARLESVRDLNYFMLDREKAYSVPYKDLLYWSGLNAEYGLPSTLRGAPQVF